MGRMVGGPCRSEMCREMRLERRVVGRRERPALSWKQREAFGICDICHSFVLGVPCVPWMCTPKRGPSAFLGSPGQHCRHHWGVPVPRQEVLAAELSSGDHVPAVGRPGPSFPCGPSLRPSRPPLCSSEVGCLPAVALFTLRCLGNPICPLRPRSEPPSRFLPGPSQRQEGLLTVGYPLQQPREAVGGWCAWKARHHLVAEPTWRSPWDC